MAEEVPAGHTRQRQVDRKERKTTSSLALKNIKPTQQRYPPPQPVTLIAPTQLRKRVKPTQVNHIFQIKNDRKCQCRQQPLEEQSHQLNPLVRGVNHPASSVEKQTGARYRDTAAGE